MPHISASALPVLAGLLAACVTTLGLWMVARKADAQRGAPALFEIASAGALVMLCMVHILPEALHRHPRAMVFIVAGLVAGAATSWFQSAALTAGASPGRRAVWAPLAAIGLHSTLDGVLYAIAFETSLASGVSSFAGLILHEIPEGAIALALLLRHGFRLGPAFVLAFLVAAATTPFGAAISAPVIRALGADATGALYAVSAGFLAFMALGPMMQPLRAHPTARGFSALIVGGVVALGFHLLPLGEHAHSASPHLHAPHDH